MGSTGWGKSEGALMELNIRRLMTLRAVRDAGGVLAAASALHLSASAASQQLSKLEREVGLQLLDRLPPGRAQLTIAGARLCEHADMIAEALRKASEEVSELVELRDQAATITTSPSATDPHLIPPATTFASHGPGSMARKIGRRIRGEAAPNQTVNELLENLREDWDLLTAAERIAKVHQSLLFIADPVSELDEFGHVLSDYTLGELYHARVVLLRLLPYLITADTAER